MSVSISIFLDTRRIKTTTGKYPVKLRLSYKRIVKLYLTIFDLTDEDFKKLNSPRIGGSLLEIKNHLKEIRKTTENAVDDLGEFSFYEFEKNFICDNPLFKFRKRKEPAPQLVKDSFDFTPFLKRFPILSETHPQQGLISIVFQSYIKSLIRHERIGSAFNYSGTYNSLKQFRGNVLFKDITVDYLYDFEHWMLGRGLAKATVGIKLRPLRAIFNLAIEEEIIRKDRNYPFGRRRYQIPASRNLKKALQMADVQKVYLDRPACPIESKARDYWLFCYFANGMNPKDVAQLKYRNIQGDYLVFERAKTELSTRSNPKLITIFLTEDLMDIINRLGNSDKSPANYIFPILRHSVSALERFDMVRAFNKFINDGMAKIAERVGNEKKVTTLVSRHTFSTQMKKAGATTEYIQEALGHTDKRTTEHYLDSFDKEVKKEFALRLTQFKSA